MKTKILITFFLLGCLFLVGCVDPSEDALKKGRNIDLARMEGIVTAKKVDYFVGDRDFSREMKGQPYYSIEITQLTSNTKETFVGVPIDVFDSVDINTKLPSPPLLTMKVLEEIKGEVIDLQSDLAFKRFFVVVDMFEDIKIFQTTPSLYYRKIKVGLKLPVVE